MQKNESIEYAKNILEKAYIEMKQNITPKFIKNLSEIIKEISDNKYGIGIKQVGDSYILGPIKLSGNNTSSSELTLKVTEKDGRSWRTKEPAIIFYYKKRWFNVIAQLKKNGTYYYWDDQSQSFVEAY